MTVIAVVARDTKFYRLVHEEGRWCEFCCFYDKSDFPFQGLNDNGCTNCEETTKALNKGQVRDCIWEEVPNGNAT